MWIIFGIFTLILSTILSLKLIPKITGLFLKLLSIILSAMIAYLFIYYFLT